jgi:hypothetical protein
MAGARRKSSLRNLLSLHRKRATAGGLACNNMGKFKPAKGEKSKEAINPKAQGAIPCLVLILGGLVMIALLFYGMMTSAAK